MRSLLVRLVIIVLLAATTAGTYVLIIRRSVPTVSYELVPRSGKAGPGSEFENAARTVAHLQEQIRKHPDQVKYLLQLAQIFLQEGRVTGNNAEYVPRAKRLLKEVFRKDPDNFEALVTQASVEATLHQFAASRALAERAIALNPHNAFAYGVLCDALLETGNDSAAVAAGDRMAAIRPDLRSYARVSYLRELHGDTRGAIAAMRSAADASIPGQENRAWVLCNLAMLYANSGASDTAEFILRGTLEERSGYPHALAGLARLEAQAGRHDTAVALYGRAIAAMNEPAFHEALGETYEAAGRPEDAIRCYDTAESLYDAEHAAGEDNAVEMASFLALHDRRLSDALRMARDGAGRRPSVHGCQTLALALFKNGLYQEAREASRRALRLGTRDASIYELARLIAERIGDKPAAEHYRALARSLGVPVHLLRFTQSGGRPRDGAVTGG